MGETTRHLSSRIKEHLNTDKASYVFQHLQESSECKSVVDHNCFSIIDHADTKGKLKLKEGLHISWLKPSLNKQVKHSVINLSVQLSLSFSSFKHWLFLCYIVLIVFYTLNECFNYIF